ncbi:MAG: hypothetical protein ACTJHW_10450 [Paenalcaligenes sp.]
MDLLDAAKEQVLADSNVVVSFFWSFNWLESQIAKKHGQDWGSGIFKSGDDGVEKLEICWSRFANYLDERIGHSVDCSKFKILCESPPMRRSIENGRWLSSRARTVSLKNAFRHIPALRNNLFHGSKGVGDPKRNTALLCAAIAVIECIYNQQELVFSG